MKMHLLHSFIYCQLNNTLRVEILLFLIEGRKTQLEIFGSSFHKADELVVWDILWLLIRGSLDAHIDLQIRHSLHVCTHAASYNGMKVVAVGQHMLLVCCMLTLNLPIKAVCKESSVVVDGSGYFLTTHGYGFPGIFMFCFLVGFCFGS